MTTLHLVELGVLGPLQVRQNGVPVSIPGAKPRAILTMLGLHGGSVVPADTLVELLWGENPPRTAGKALQTHVSLLRRTLGDGFVLTEGAGWALAGTEVDALRYRSAARLGRDAVAAGDTSQAVARFEEALALWRGIPELPDGRRGTSEKTRWIEGHAALVEDRADALLATGRAAEIIGELEAAVTDAPLRERRWGQLMLALYRAGRQGEALGAYKRARALLADELGVDPGPELRRLEAAIVAQDAALEVPAAQEVTAVTRAVTFLLTDIEGSTAAWEADAAAMAVALARHDELVEQVVTSRGGRLIKTRGEGDATFSVFERPSSAAAAALELQEAIAREPWALREPMRIRVALHTGEVELRDGDYFGRAVNRAARLRSLATGGQILCSGATAELVIDSLSDDVVLVDLGTRQLRNLARPEHVFELRLESAVDQQEADLADAPVERPPLPAVLAGPGPFVGRGHELERLSSAWRTVLAGGTNAMLIAGEPGVGKTRLAGEWCRLAYDQGGLVIYGRCDEDLGAPYQPFAEALRSVVPCLGSSRLRGLRGVESLLPLVPGLTDVLPDLAGPTRADPDTERYALFDAVVALLEVASASVPVVLILDDLHWAAKPTLLLLRHLLRFGEHSRVQIVGTYRSTDLDRSHPLAAMLADLHRDGTANRLQLGGLDEHDVTLYVAEAGYEDEELGRALASVTGGNPFFLIEALRHVDESGGRWDQSTLPQGVREAVSRRLTRLAPETNKALAAAAVVGSRFALELVERVVGDDLVDAFDEAGKAGIVIEEPGGRYRFNHAIVRQSLLAELPSVRRMRLHQRIATTLESEPGADDELLAELAYHYFECAWAGNAAKAVEYCQRAADQAMARLAYEGAADLYDRALHALEEIDDELPDRDDQIASLLIARCEALLAAGDVTSATGAVAQLQESTLGSARLAAWATCFDGELSMLIHPERLDEIEAAVGAAAEKLAEVDDAAGQAKAHTVRAGCLARLGRIGDCEVALDDALTAARRAREHRRVNNVLANAPLAALWGPNPVPRAGGRCLDVVRLLRITTDSPAVEATSTRCQAVLEAFRGRAAAARRMIDSARRTVTELGLRHALLEVEQFAGIVELVVDDPAEAEPHLRLAYKGFRRMGLDADTAETAAVLGRACLALDRDDEAGELCSESERLAGHALKPSIAWRTLRARLLARQGEHVEARRVAEEAVNLAERTDALVDHADACLALATVLGAAGDTAGARAAGERAVGLYEQKGAVALAEKARLVVGGREVPAVPSAPVAPETPVVEVENACVRVGERAVAAIDRQDWDEFERLFAPDAFVESHRKIVGFTRIDVPSDWARANRHVLERDATVAKQVVIGVRGECLALARLVLSAADVSPGAPHDEFLQLYGIDEAGRIALQVWFDVDDLDAAIAELDATYARFEQVGRRAPLENGASRVDARLNALGADRRWDELSALLADGIRVEDRRRGFRSEGNGRAAVLAEARAIADLGAKKATSQVLAVRGERLALVRIVFWGQLQKPEAYQTELLRIAEIDADGRLAAHLAFDPDDFDAALAELDARYVAGEAAPYSRTWSVIAESFASISRGELFRATPDCASIDHRRAAAFAPGDLIAYVRAGFDLDQQIRPYFETVHRLNDFGAVVTHAARGSSREGFDAEWRGVNISTVDGDMINRVEIFDEADLDAAIVRFDQLSRPAARPENAACRSYERMQACFAARDWDTLADTLIDDVHNEDRRRVVNLGVQQGRDEALGNVRRAADLGVTHATSNVVATRGEQLALTHAQFSQGDLRSETFHVDVLQLVEIDADERIAALVMFDPDDFEAAIAELDARYLVGEAAAHAQAWSVITRAYSALNRHEHPATTPDWVNIDRRRGISFAPGHVSALLTNWLATADIRNSIEAVHRLNDLGAVVTSVTHETSQEGFQAEWRGTSILTVKGDSIDRLEVFDEADLDAAIAKFDQLSRPAVRLENAAARVFEHAWSYLADRDWDAMAETVAENYVGIDHRRVVNAEIQHGRDTVIRDLQAAADVGFTISMVSAIAIRGERLVLARVRASGLDVETIQNDALNVVEVDPDERIATVVVYDLEDLDAALEELDARYLAGEAARYADTWSVITRAHTALNRHELPLTTPDCVSLDHRRGTAFGPGELIEYFRAGRELNQDIRTYVEVVHRLSELGAVCTHVGQGVSHEGFDAEWRGIDLLTVEGEMVNRCEVFDEADLDTAIARFDELSLPTPRLENATTRAYERIAEYFAARDWDATANAMAENMVDDDRRHMVNAGIRRGRDVEIANSRATAEIGGEIITSTAIATRGERLALCRSAILGRGAQSDAFRIEFLSVIEIDADERLVAHVAFNLDDFDAAITELDARYLDGEAAAHARTWSVITAAKAAVNRHELPPTTPDSVSVDHRRATAFAPGELTDYVRAGWDVGHDVRTYVEVVHRLSDLGTVCTHVGHGRSREGFEAEWRGIDLLTVEGDIVNRCEIFDEADLDEAIARFEELSLPAPRLENVASQAGQRYLALIAAGDWDSMSRVLADNFSTDDRRRVVGAGLRHGRDALTLDLRAIANLPIMNVTSTVMATRGERLVLLRSQFSNRDPISESFLTEVLVIVEVDAQGQIVAAVAFDADDIDAAFRDLDARYLAGEAAPYVRTWSVIAENYAAFNRHEVPAADWVTVDHRQGTPFESSNMTPAIRRIWDLTPDLTIHVEVVHRLDDAGAVLTHKGSGSSQEGFDAEWRAVDLLITEGDRINRCEIFDEADIDAAIARFEELSQPAPRLENAATQATERLWTYITAGDWESIEQILAGEFLQDDRRGVVGAGLRHGRDAEIKDLRAIADMRITNVTLTAIATRGEGLSLARVGLSFRGQGPEAYLTELLGITQIDADNLITAAVAFDLEDIDAAIDELDARYLAGEAARCASVWERALDTLRELNRHEPGSMINRLAYTDHRRVPFGDGNYRKAIEELWPLVPDARYRVQAVHALDDHGVVASLVIEGTDTQGNELQWPRLFLLDPDEPRLEVYEEGDVDNALARLEELRRKPPRPENAASRVVEQFLAHFAVRNWDAMAELLADDLYADDRRLVVNAGIRRGRDVDMANWRATADLWSTCASSTVAIRGERLALSRFVFSSQGQSSDAFSAAALVVAEINDDNRIERIVVIESDDVDAAYAELDARYLAGEAAAHAHAWSVVSGAYAAMNRHELFPTTPDWANVDHRRPGIIEDGGLNASLLSLWELIPDVTFRVEAVHRLTDLGAVCTHAAHGVSHDGFNAEWRGIEVLTVEGHLINGCEIFDEADVDAAIARFDQLSRPASLLENTATRVNKRLWAHVGAHDWDAVSAILAYDYHHDDRRRMAGAGVLRGRDAGVRDMKAIAEIAVNMAPEVMAIRGERLALTRARFSGLDQQPQASLVEVLAVFEIDADERIAAVVSFDYDDIDAAFAELDARYLADEAAAHARAWSAIVSGYAALNQHEVPPTAPDWANVDHRRLIAFAPGEMPQYFRATFDVAPDIKGHIEVVHRLSNIGAVFTHALRGTSQEGFDATWRETVILTVDRDVVNLCEMFDESDLDAALARFDELEARAPQLENAATQVLQRLQVHFEAHDWDALADALAGDIRTEDRRRVVSAGIRHGRDAELESLRATADVGTSNVTSTFLATRGQRLVLAKSRLSSLDPRPSAFHADMLGVVEIDTDNRVAAVVVFEIDDIDAAFTELEARYLAGEAAPYARVWQLGMDTIAELNRHEAGPMIERFEYADHRRIPFASGEEFGRGVEELWALVPDARYWTKAVHALDSHGSVTSLVIEGADTHGSELQWDRIILFACEEPRVEVYEEDDVDSALARFDELRPHTPRLANTASRMDELFAAYFAARDWDAMAEQTADAISVDDRRHAVNAGLRRGRGAQIANLRTRADIGMEKITSTVVAIRGERLALTRTRFSGHDQRPNAFHTEALCVVEIDPNNRIVARVGFDLDDIDAAFAELDARYLAGEAAAHSHAWSVIAEVYAAFNRRELPAADWITIDHRRGTPSTSSDLIQSIRTSLDLTPDLCIHIEMVHQIGNFGAVLTNTSYGTSQEGFNAEWRMVQLLTVEGDRINRLELFDEDDLDTALARFEELRPATRRLENAASQVYERFFEHYGSRDWDAMSQILANGTSFDDRRRVVNAGVWRGRHVVMANMQKFEAEANIALTVIATRGERLALNRFRSVNHDLRHGEFDVELLAVVELDAENQISTHIAFDPDDIDAAIEELDARYLAGEAAAHPHTWELVTRAYRALNRRQLPETTPDWVNIDHRRLAPIPAGDLGAYLLATWELSPQSGIRIESVHRLSEVGAVVTQVVEGTSHQGFDAEWRTIDLSTYEGDKIQRSELFDEADLDAALARFDELNRHG